MRIELSSFPLLSLMCSALILLILPFQGSWGLANNDQDSDAGNALDDTPPSVRITGPSWCSDDILPNESLMIRGTASDQESGLKKVEAFSQLFPPDSKFPYLLATPDSEGNWSSWSFPATVYENKTRVLVRATDNAGNENWTEVIIDSELTKEKSHGRVDGAVAFVEPSFTEAAYNIDGFYEFYAKYQAVKPGDVVDNDLNLLTADIPDDPDRNYVLPLMHRVQDFVGKGVPVSLINDIDVHDGFIFKDDGTDVYRAIFLLHSEYVTQQEYDNLRRYVSNGGILVLIDSNAFYAEVSFDKEACTVTLIEGHDWEFDGAVAKRGVSERYFEENREWVGSNYMINALWDPVSFNNNPFNYTHFEQNYVTNPKAKILYDYGFAVGENYGSDEWHENETVAAYELEYGGGKTLSLGIYGQNKADDPVFLDFFEDVMLMHALGDRYVVKIVDDGYPVYWHMNSGSVNFVAIDPLEKKVTVTVNGPLPQDDVLKISLPKELIDVKVPSNNNGFSSSLGNDTILPSDVFDADAASSDSYELGVTLTDSQGATYTDGRVNQFANNYERVIEIPLTPYISTIEIYGEYVVPEFPLASPMVLATSAVVISVAITRFLTRKSFC